MLKQCNEGYVSLCNLCFLFFIIMKMLDEKRKIINIISENIFKTFIVRVSEYIWNKRFSNIRKKKVYESFFLDHTYK